jgi:hypothetical protein
MNRVARPVSSFSPRVFVMGSPAGRYLASAAELLNRALTIGHN